MKLLNETGAGQISPVKANREFVAFLALTADYRAHYRAHNRELSSLPSPPSPLPLPYPFPSFAPAFARLPPRRVSPPSIGECHQRSKSLVFVW